MIFKLKLLIYYGFVSRLPHSRFAKFFNKIRIYFVCRILRIMQYDKNSYFEPNIYISNGKNIKIGKHCHINENVFIQGGIIGDYCMIAPNVSILSGMHNYSNTLIPMIKQGGEINKISIIEDDVWIGRNVVLMPGIKIGKGCIVGAGAVVTKNVEPYSVIGGVPARLLKKRD